MLAQWAHRAKRPASANQRGWRGPTRCEMFAMTAVPVAHTPRATLTPLRLLALAVASVAAVLAHSPAQAAGYAPSGAFLQVGAGENELKTLTAGAVWQCAC
eukprot:Opistho-1_new@49853